MKRLLHVLLTTVLVAGGGPVAAQDGVRAYFTGAPELRFGALAEPEENARFCRAQASGLDRARALLGLRTCSTTAPVGGNALDRQRVDLLILFDDRTGTEALRKWLPPEAVVMRSGRTMVRPTHLLWNGFRTLIVGEAMSRSMLPPEWDAVLVDAVRQLPYGELEQSEAALRLPFARDFDAFRDAAERQLCRRIVCRSDQDHFIGMTRRHEAALRRIHEDLARAGASPGDPTPVQLQISRVRRSEGTANARVVIDIGYGLPTSNAPDHHVPGRVPPTIPGITDHGELVDAIVRGLAYGVPPAPPGNCGDIGHGPACPYLENLEAYGRVINAALLLPADAPRVFDEALRLRRFPVDDCRLALPDEFGTVARPERRATTGAGCERARKVWNEDFTFADRHTARGAPRIREALRTAYCEEYVRMSQAVPGTPPRCQPPF